MANLLEKNKKVNKHYKSNIIEKPKENNTSTSSPPPEDEDDKLEDGSLMNISKQEKQGLLSHDNEEQQQKDGIISTTPSSLKSPKEIEFNNRNPRVSNVNIGPDKVIDLDTAIKASKTDQSFPIGKMFKNPGILVMYIFYLYIFYML